MSFNLMKALSCAWNRLSLRRNLNTLELDILNAWKLAFPRDDGVIIDRQLSSISFVQRQAGGSKVCLYYSCKNPPPMLKDQRPDVCSAVVKFRRNGHYLGIAKIFTHRGLVFSIEFGSARTVSLIERLHHDGEITMSA